MQWAIRRVMQPENNRALKRNFAYKGLCFQGIFVDEEGYYAEGATMNVAILTQEGELVVNHKL